MYYSNLYKQYGFIKNSVKFQLVLFLIFLRISTSFFFNFVTNFNCRLLFLQINLKVFGIYEEKVKRFLDKMLENILFPYKMKLGQIMLWERNFFIFHFEFKL